MNNAFFKLHKYRPVFHGITLIPIVIGLVAFLSAAANQALAQTIVASDVAANYGSFSGNKGFGFGSWVVSTPGGGSYISGDSPKLFALWNGAANSTSTALRPFNAPLTVGGTFSVQLRMGNLNTETDLNIIQLQDAAGNVLFSFWHHGNDPAGIGHYTDASGTHDTPGSGFPYDYNVTDTYTFTLDTATTYTFQNNTAGGSFSGTLASGGPISQVVFLRSNTGPHTGGGNDFKFNALTVTTSAVLPPAFVQQPVNSGGMTGSTISLTAVASSSQTINYQWYHDNTQVPGQTSTNLVLNNVTLAQAGNYKLVATAAAGSSTSAVAVVTIYPFGYTNAYDVAASYGGSFFGNQGYGFNPWVLNTTGGYGGNYVNTSFGLWNRGTDGAQSTAFRTFKTPLAVGGTFLVDLQQNTLDGVNFQNAIQFLDPVGNVIFTFYHQGQDAESGHYIDANGPGTATGFAYEAGRWESFAFVLNSASTYTFYNITRGVSFSGTLSGAPVAAVKFVRVNLAEAPANNGQDFLFNNLVLLTPNSVPPMPAKQPVSCGGMEGSTLQLSALATSTQTVNYQWYHNDALLLGATSTNLVLTNITSAQAGNYTVVFSSSSGSSTSAVAVVTVYPFGYTNAYDVAANYSSISGNKGMGFGAWVVNTPGGGSYVNGDGFYLWNNGAASQSTVVRPLIDPLAVGGTLLVDLQIARNMEGPDFQNGIQLQDAMGNVLFSFYHQGGDDQDGHYTDAAGPGTATGFSYAVGRFEQFAFVLTSSTTYTLYNITTGASITGTLSGEPITQISFVRANLVGATTTGGHDFGFNNLVVLSPTGKAPVLQQPVSSGGLLGGPVSLSGTASSSVPVFYQWYIGTTAIPGATNATLTFGNASFTNAGDYTLVATNIFGSVTSSVVSLTVYAENSRLLAYEGFNYDAMFSIAGQNGGSGWNEGWVIQGDQEGVYTLGAGLLGTTNAPQGYDDRSAGVSLSTIDGIRSGRFLDCSNTGVFAKRGYIDSKGNIGADGKTIYVSFLMQPRDLVMFYECEFYRGNIGDRIGGIGNDLSGTTVNLRTSGTQTAIGEGNNTSPDFFVVRIDFKAGNDDVRVYRNPVSLTEPGTPTLSVTNASDMSFNAVGVGSWFNTVVIDEIRIGATWEDALGLQTLKMLPPTKAAQGWNVNFAATPNSTYRVLKSDKIVGPWNELGSSTIQENGFGSIPDPAPVSGQSFYRLVTP